MISCSCSWNKHRMRTVPSIWKLRRCNLGIRVHIRYWKRHRPPGFDPCRSHPRECLRSAHGWLRLDGERAGKADGSQSPGDDVMPFQAGRVASDHTHEAGQTPLCQTLRRAYGTDRRIHGNRGTSQTDAGNRIPAGSSRPAAPPATTTLPGTWRSSSPPQCRPVDSLTFETIQSA